MATTLAKTCVTRYSFIDEEFLEIVYYIFEIESQHLIKPKQIIEFDDKVAKAITHILEATLITSTYTVRLDLLIITE